MKFELRSVDATPEIWVPIEFSEADLQDRAKFLAGISAMALWVWGQLQQVERSEVSDGKTRKTQQVHAKP